jgi:hypothetical protein
MKTLLPWIVVIVLLAGLGLLFSANQRQAADLARLQGPSQDSQSRTDDAGKASAPGSQDELARLRKENEDLLRLRNEVRQLKDGKQQLAKQLQAAQQAIPSQQQQQEMQKAMAEVQQLRAHAQQMQQTNLAAVCVSNLRQIEAAKQQWALENNRPAGSVVGTQDVAPYLPTKTFPLCPAGGVYTINTIGANPSCNIPGHIIPRP